jgi:mono/diheme cytochrome c family protein
VVLTVVAIFGFRGHRFDHPPLEIFPDMKRQPKVKFQTDSKFWSDGQANRMPIPGTVALQMPSGFKSEQEEYYFTGKMGDHWGDGIPVEINAALLARGKERYTINCQVCHGALGMGNGITSKYGLVGAANYHVDRLRQMADGEIYNTLVHGKNTMMGYGANVRGDDRWAIVAYVRALQRSQNATLADVPEADKAGLLKK